MRASRFTTSKKNSWDHLLQQNNGRSIVMMINTDAVNTVILQAGPSPGSTDEGWPVLAGNVFTLDPANPLFAQAIQGDWWISSPSGNLVVMKMFIG